MTDPSSREPAERENELRSSARSLPKAMTSADTWRAMSRENVERARRGYEEFNRTGVPPLRLFHPDAEFDATRTLPDTARIPL